MDEERSMILKMLQDGKISVEEAEALMEVLEEQELAPELERHRREGTGGDRAEGTTAEDGFSGTDSVSAGDGPSGDAEIHEEAGKGAGGADAKSGERTDERSDERTDERTGAGRAGRGREFQFDFGPEFAGLGNELRGIFGKVGELVRRATEQVEEQVGDIDVGERIREAFGGEVSGTEVSGRIAAASAERLVVHNRWGGIRLSGEERDDIEVHVDVSVYGASKEEAESLADSVRVASQAEGASLILFLEPAETLESERVRANYTVRVPRRMASEITALSGTLTLEALEGETHLTTSSGDVLVQQIASPVTVKSRSGNVTAGGLGASCQVSTTSGDVLLEDLAGPVHVNSKSGDVRARRVAREIVVSSLSGAAVLEDLQTAVVEARSKSGDITVEMSEGPVSRVDLQTLSGDVVLTLPAGTAGVLSCKTTSGTIACDLEVEAEHRSRNSLRGTFGVARAAQGAEDQSAEARLTSVSGDIRIKEPC